MQDSRQAKRFEINSVARKRKRDAMSAESHDKDHDSRQQEAGDRPGQRDDDLPPRRPIAIVARSQAAQAIERDPRVTAVVSLHRGMAQFMDQDRNEHYNDPNQGVDGIYF